MLAVEDAEESDPGARRAGVRNGVAAAEGSLEAPHSPQIKDGTTVWPGDPASGHLSIPEPPRPPALGAGNGAAPTSGHGVSAAPGEWLPDICPTTRHGVCSSRSRVVA